MEEEWVVKRCQLRQVWLEHPEWSKRQLAEAVGHSKFWVKKWLKRIRRSTPEDQEVLQAYSRARKRPPPQTAAEVVTRILEIRDDPPPKLGRVPGPVTILYYLQKDRALQKADCVLPRSTRRIWKTLDQHQRIPRSAEPNNKTRRGLTLVTIRRVTSCSILFFGDFLMDLINSILIIQRFTTSPSRTSSGLPRTDTAPADNAS